MSKLIKSDVIFVKKPHSYVSKEGYPIIGLTSLLRKHKITKDVSKIPKAILNKATERGTLIHQQCEDYDLLGIIPDNEWAIAYTELNLTVLESEFLVSYQDIVATQIDKILDDYSVCDIKTSYDIDITGVTWQCSVGAYMLEKQCNIKVPNIYCIHLRNGNVEKIKLDRITDEQIEALLECERKGIAYDGVITREIVPEIPRHLSFKANDIYLAIKKMERLKEELNKEIIDYMEQNDIIKLKSDTISFTLVPHGITKTLDKDKLTKDFPDIDLKKYQKESLKKSYLKVTLKK